MPAARRAEFLGLPNAHREGLGPFLGLQLTNSRYADLPRHPMHLARLGRVDLRWVAVVDVLARVNERYVLASASAHKPRVELHRSRGPPARAPYTTVPACFPVPPR
jgi:hypothetical protein